MPWFLQIEDVTPNADTHFQPREDGEVTQLMSVSFTQSLQEDDFFEVESSVLGGEQEFGEPAAVTRT